MRRLVRGSVFVFSCGRFPGRFFGDTVATPEEARDAISTYERRQREEELAVDTRSVVFACAASADHRARIAAAEAFDVAAAALPRAPNFCFMSLSLDYAAMIDAPEVVWFNLCKANDVTTSSVRPQQLHMVGGATRHQRPGGGYIQVLLGCIPDLETDVFTFDAVPEEEDLRDAARPPPALCFAMLDNKLTLQYEHVLSERLQLLGGRLQGLPIVGGIFPPCQKTNNNDDAKKQTAGADERDESENAGASMTNEMGDSIFFCNDRVYTGSAACMLLRSVMVKGHQVDVVPSIGMERVKVTSVSCSKGVFRIATLNDKRATDVIRDVYCSQELVGKTSKVFLGVQHNGVCLPLSFFGYPESGTLQFTTPNGVEIHAGDTIELLVDDVELDSEAAAALLINLQKKLSIAHVTKDITVAREARKNIVASSLAGFHFSHGGMNVVARPEVNVTLGNASTLYAPSVLQRCLGKCCPTSGFFSPGQVFTLGNCTGVYARSSSYAFLEGLR
ncbi:hypothetical protein TRSC58_00603 [Trypanosoma rangeli SC58]|uniref:FIST domain-containing protein n=1 Tax=Trypanosoma rangeli SC58 TaxID=429131 RepID=A0A061JE02_TRYRA|nr:hypothetical protein TRSC58_00603 [Trypanosoma rangeli SC58]